MTKKQPRKGAAAANPYGSSASRDDLDPAHQIAFDLVAERRDLEPSVERIMKAGLGEAATVRALTLFRESLTSIGDPCRDPRVAIARCAAAG